MAPDAHGCTGDSRSVAGTCHPVSLPEARNLRLDLAQLRFEGLTTEALTALFCFHLSAGVGDANYETQLTLKIPIDRRPEDRDAQVSRSIIIKDRSSFLRDIQCLAWEHRRTCTERLRGLRSLVPNPVAGFAGWRWLW